MHRYKSSSIEPTDKQLKILMVEDSRVCQFVQSALLEELGFKADIATSGEEALTMYNSEYCAVMLDVHLPGINGLKVSKAIRKFTYGKNTPIIGLTIEGSKIHKACLAAGYNQVLAKPANISSLGAALGHYFPNLTTNGSVC